MGIFSRKKKEEKKIDGMELETISNYVEGSMEAIKDVGAVLAKFVPVLSKYKELSTKSVELAKKRDEQLSTANTDLKELTSQLVTIEAKSSTLNSELNLVKLEMEILTKYLEDVVRVYETIKGLSITASVMAAKRGEGNEDIYSLSIDIDKTSVVLESSIETIQQKLSELSDKVSSIETQFSNITIEYSAILESVKDIKTKANIDESLIKSMELNCKEIDYNNTEIDSIKNSFCEKINILNDINKIIN